MDLEQQRQFMRVAMAEAELAIQEGNSPYGAVLVDSDGNIIAQGHNTAKSDCDPTAHAEMNVLRKAAKILGRLEFDGCTMIANSESCSMCMSGCIKFHVYSFCFGAQAGNHMDPYILPADIARETTQPITITTKILANECDEQIARGKNNY